MLIIVAVGAYMLWVKMVERILYVPLTIPDRMLGSLFGIVKVGVLIAAGCVLLMQAAPNRVATVVAASKLAPPLLQTAQIITTVLPREVKNEFRRSYSRVQQQLGQQVAQPCHTERTTFRSPSPSQATQTPADMAADNDHTLRQLIKKYSQE